MRGRKLIVPIVAVVLTLVIVLIDLISCSSCSCGARNDGGCPHEWREATCNSPRICTICGETTGEPLTHFGGRATCVEKAICDGCGFEYGYIDHENHEKEPGYIKWLNVHQYGYPCCRVPIGEEEPHNIVDGVCTVCGFKPSFGGSTVTANPGQQTVIMVVSITDNPGVLSMELTVSYDDSVLTLKSVTSGKAFKDLTFTASNSLESGCKFLWDGESISGGEIQDGEILILEFSVSSNAPLNTYSVTFDAKAYDNHLDLIDLMPASGQIIVK